MANKKIVTLMVNVGARRQTLSGMPCKRCHIKALKSQVEAEKTQKQWKPVLPTVRDHQSDYGSKLADSQHYFRQARIIVVFLIVSVFFTT